MKKAAVIGHPISHSLSPRIFQFLSGKLLPEGEALDYQAVDIAPLDLRTGFSKLKTEPGFVGCNVTIPHKEKIMTLLDQISPEARAINAVNVVDFKNSKASGKNTDVPGIMATLAFHGVDIQQKDVLLFGAGGAAKAVAYAAANLKAANVYIWNRNRARAEELTQRFNAFFPATKFTEVSGQKLLTKLKSLKPALVVNATSFGMEGTSLDNYELNLVWTALFQTLHTEPSEIRPFAFDLIYRPKLTHFLKMAEDAGWNAIGGIDMLIEQALATWEIWFGKIESKELLRKQLLAVTNDSRDLFLTGFMGSGKSTVGAQLARHLGSDFFDVDLMVERKSGMSISHIFEQRGEAYFRDLEKEVIQELIDQKADKQGVRVIALGGGSLLNPDTRTKIAASGSLVYLRASPTEILNRLKDGGNRPLLGASTQEEKLFKIENLLKERQALYEQAPFAIDTDGKEPEALAKSIMRETGFKA